MLLQGCLNGARSRSEHPGCPTTPDELARDAAEVVDAGIAALHVHPRDDDGNETLAGGHLAEALAAMRNRVAVPIGVSTGAWLLPDPIDRLRAIERWDILPDYASVNFHESGAVEIARLLLDRGVGVEAGLWHEQGAAVLMDSDLAPQCMRMLFEPMEQSFEEALANVKAIENLTSDLVPDLPRLLHGHERTTWVFLLEAARRGYQGRIGFEDTIAGPDGQSVDSNADLAKAAIELVCAD